jgi:hypothetical protein
MENLKQNILIPIVLLLALTYTTARANPDWVPATNLQYNMQVVAYLQLPDETYSLNPNDLVAAFVGDECRGLASPLLNADGRLFLSIASNETGGETITFKAWLESSGQIAELHESFEFEDQLGIGDYNDPFIFTIDILHPPVTYLIVANAGEHGSISPAGEIVVPHGTSQLFTFTPDQDYEVFDVEVNGESVGNPENYEFEQVTASQTIHVSFALISSAHAHILRNDGFRVFPNPASQQITIAVENKKIDHFSYSIADQNGKQVLQGEIKSNLQQINLSPLKNGIYVLQLRQHNKLIASEKVIKYDW